MSALQWNQTLQRTKRIVQLQPTSCFFSSTTTTGTTPTSSVLIIPLPKHQQQRQQRQNKQLYSTFATLNPKLNNHNNSISVKSTKPHHLWSCSRYISRSLPSFFPSLKNRLKSKKNNFNKKVVMSIAKRVVAKPTEFIWTGNLRDNKGARIKVTLFLSLFSLSLYHFFNIFFLLDIFIYFFFG